MKNIPHYPGKVTIPQMQSDLPIGSNFPTKVYMRIEKKVLNDALRVLGKVVCQTSPVELYRSIRFVGDVDGVMAMATDGVEVVSVILDAFAESEIDFCVPFKELKEQVRIGRSETIELTGSFIEFPASEEPAADAVSVILPVNFGELLAQAAPIVDRTGYRRVLHGINLSNAGVTVTDGSSCFMGYIFLRVLNG